MAERLAVLVRLDGINLRGGSSKAWPGGREQVKEVKDALRMLRELWRERAALLMLTLNEQDRLLAALLPALKALFNVACEYYDLLKDLRSALDFDDLEGGALDLVAQRPAVQARWQRDLKAVLVDEFQDTNGRQRDLLSYLNDTGSKLFIVGDAKQSIYRFRGADVAVFRAERARIADEGGAALSLETSYRAHRPLVQGLNDLLLPVLGDTPDAHRPWAEPFAPLQAHREAPAQGLAPPYIEAHLALGSKQDGALLRAAQALTMRLMALVEGVDVRVPDEGEQRPLHYGDIAILCRASTSFSAYEDALEQAGVPFLTVAGRGFYGRPEIRDLLNALQALADPTDDLALAGLLRSPALALSDAGLYHLCEQQEPGTALWDVLRNAGADLPGVDGPRAVRAVQLIAELHGQVGRAPVADLLKAFLDHTDYGAALLQAGQERARRNIAKLLADAHASGIVSVGEFLDYVNGLRDTGAREGEARAMAENAVQIMSVHAAKGLEFPIVVIGDVSYANRRRDSVHVTPDFGVLLSLKDEEDKDIIPAIYKLGKERAQDQEAAESDRLFYVAATRAKELLILSGIVGQTKSGNLSLRGWLKQLAEAGALALDEVALPDQEPEDAPEIHSVDLTVGQTPVHCAFYFAKWAWQPPHIATPEFESPDAPVPPPLLASITPAPAAATPDLDPKAAALSERSPPQRVWRGVPVVKYRTAPAWVVGSLVHEALAMWRFPDGDFRAWAEARARAYGITDRGQLDHAVRESRRLLSRFQKHPFYTEMDGAERRLHEVPYSLEIEEPGEDGEAGGVTSGIIDALYLQDGTWTIIEFKTDRLRNEADLHKLFAEEDYLAQARRYRVAVQRLLGQEPRVVFCMLNYGREIHLHWLK